MFSRLFGTPFKRHITSHNGIRGRLRQQLWKTTKLTVNPNWRDSTDMTWGFGPYYPGSTDTRGGINDSQVHRVGICSPLHYTTVQCSDYIAQTAAPASQAGQRGRPAPVGRLVSPTGPYLTSYNESLISCTTKCWFKLLKIVKLNDKYINFFLSLHLYQIVHLSLHVGSDEHMNICVNYIMHRILS